MLPFFPTDGGGGDGGKAFSQANDWSKNNIFAGAAAVVPGFGQIFGAQMAADAQRETNAMTERNFREQVELQREFAKHGIKWKIQDAKEAGISPLAALGASGASYQPTQTTYGSPKAAWAEAGQNLSDMAFKNHLQTMQIEGSQLDNELKLAQIGKLKAEAYAIANPAVQSEMPTNEYANPKAQPQIDWVNLPGNRIQAQMSVDTASRVQDDLPAKLRFQVDRAMGMHKPPDSKLPKGMTRWVPTGVEGVWEARPPKNSTLKKYPNLQKLMNDLNYDWD